MKIVNAEWELRNLGKRTVELTLEKKDFSRKPKEIYTDIQIIEKEYQSEYTVVKIKTGKPEIGWELQKHGFFHIETQIITRAFGDDIKDAIKKYQPLYPNTKQQEISSMEEISWIQREIEKGIFTTDRIALDPRFGPQIANHRYANWIKDEYVHGGHIAYTSVDGERVAFTLYREKGFARWGLLTGVFLAYACGRYGGHLLFSNSVDMVKNGISVMYGAISANNHDVFSLHEMFGHRLKTLLEVYTRHLN